MQLQVIKSDSTVEPYMHTKVLSTFNSSLDDVGQTDIAAAEQFAEAVTFHLYHNNDIDTIKSNDIHKLALIVLHETGHTTAAEVLREHRLYRSLRRAGIEITSRNGDGRTHNRVWNKSIVIDELTGKHGLERGLARAVASSVEGKILNLNMRHIDQMLLEQLVIAETEMVIKADHELTLAAV